MSELFYNANNAFCYYYDKIVKHGIEWSNTKALFNIGFTIVNPMENLIFARKWSVKYAEREWEWYNSQNRSVEELKKYAPIWDKMHNGDNIVNSNYGWQWNRNSQLEKVINKLKTDKTTRQAVLSIYDGKEIDEYAYDTPCTMNISFNIIADSLCMSVYMRSNDLWYGFCNDQYCFSKLQEYVAKELGIKIGWYYHFATNLHLYNDTIEANQLINYNKVEQ